jgi:hypothetical protein
MQIDGTLNKLTTVKFSSSYFFEMVSFQNEQTCCDHQLPVEHLLSICFPHLQLREYIDDTEDYINIQVLSSLNDMVY